MQNYHQIQDMRTSQFCVFELVYVSESQSF